ALRLAKCHTGKYEFVSYWGGFHGKTMGALSLMGSTFKDKLGPMVPGAHQIPYADCYRCPVGLQYPSCGIACAEIGRKQVKTAGVVGDVLKRELETFVERYPFVGFVDGAGLLIRMELVADKKTKQPLPRKVTERIFTEAVKRGLLTMAYSASFRIQPALTIDEGTAKNGVEILREVFDVVERERLWQA